MNNKNLYSVLGLAAVAGVAYYFYNKKRTTIPSTANASIPASTVSSSATGSDSNAPKQCPTCMSGKDCNVPFQSDYCNKLRAAGSVSHSNPFVSNVFKPSASSMNFKTNF